MFSQLFSSCLKWHNHHFKDAFPIYRPDAITEQALHERFANKVFTAYLWTKGVTLNISNKQGGRLSDHYQRAKSNASL